MAALGAQLLSTRRRSLQLAALLVLPLVPVAACAAAVRDAATRRALGMCSAASAFALYAAARVEPR